QGLRADRPLERGRCRVLEGFGNAVLSGPPPRPPHLISNTIEHRLANIGLEHTGPADLDRIQDLDGAEERLLDQIVGIEERAGVGGKAPAGPAHEAWAIALHQGSKRGTVAPFGAAQQVARDHELGSRRPVVDGTGLLGHAAPLRDEALAGWAAWPSRRWTAMPHGS